MKKAEQYIIEVEREMEHDHLEEAMEKLYRAQNELQNQLILEERFWKQKAHIKWLAAGDRNTKFFHATVKQRRFQALIHQIKRF